MARVFDQVRRTDSRPGRYAESCYSFLNRALGSPWARVRRLIEGWFSRYPEREAKGDLYQRLRSRDDAQMLGAFWELYLHEALWRCGFEVEPQAKGPSAPKKPDFLVRGGSQDFYVEATTVLPRREERAAVNRRSEIYDLLDGQVLSPNFFLWLEVESVGSRTPSKKKLVADLNGWLSTLDPDGIEARLQGRNTIRCLPPFLWRLEDWVIRFRAIPKPPNARGEVAIRPIGVMDDEEVRVLNPRDFESRLEAKAGRYGELDAPYVIAALWDDPLAAEDDIQAGLWGPLKLQIVHGPEDPVPGSLVYGPGGLWGSPSRPRHTGVSAVLSALCMRPWSIPRIQPRLWNNAWAKHPLQVDLPWGATSVGQGGQFESYPPAVPPDELFVLDPSWPGLRDKDGSADLVDQAVIDGFVGKIAAQYEPDRIILFGSYACGDPTLESDVDLLVEMPFDGQSLEKSLEILNRLDLPSALDLLAYRPEEIRQRYEEGDPVVREAIDKGRVLYEKERSRSGFIRRIEISQRPSVN